MYVDDYNDPLSSPRDKAIVGFPMVLLSLAIGFVVGALVFGALEISTALTALFFNVVPDAIGAGKVYLPIVCTAGGLVIGLWACFTGVVPRSLESVMAHVKKTGGYTLEGGLWRNIVAFLLPLAFGGSVGPEAGLTGIIAGSCTWIGNRLKKAGLQAKAVSDLTLSASLSAIFGQPFLGVVAAAEEGMPAPEKVSFRKPVKIVLYMAAAFGAFAAAAIIGSLTGLSGGLPRFDSINPQPLEFLWFIPFVAVAYVLGLVFHTATSLSQRLSAAIATLPKAAVVVAPAACGLILGCIGMFLPYVMFAGEAQATALQSEWTTFSAAALLLTALVKLIVTPLCLGTGWRGGTFFPMIFAGVSAGYGLGALTGVDPMFAVAVTTTALAAVVTRKPILALSLVLLCFPLSGIVWLGLSAVVGSAIPLPRALVSFQSKPTETEKSHE